ncbi:dephospho-CoA kinase [Candidatus Woesearchaeota archaeon]|nr:dephospho-CoA kinase [Candidatus Woesearchaeota archaeon]
MIPYNASPLSAPNRHILGVTGIAGSGKSYVCKRFIDLAGKASVPARHIDLDAVSHGIQSSPGEYEEVRSAIEQIAPGVRNPDGTIDRKKLASIVMPDATKLQQLDAIMHPAVLEATVKNAQGIEGLLIIEAALFAETDTCRLVDHNMVLVYCDSQMQFQRLKLRGYSSERIQQARTTQYPSEKKRQTIVVSSLMDCYGKHWEIDNHGAEADKRIEACFKDVWTYFSGLNAMKDKSPT